MKVQSIASTSANNVIPGKPSTTSKCCKSLNANFNTINDRICTANFRLKYSSGGGLSNNKFGDSTNTVNVVFICAYAPTLENTKKDQAATETFYSQLEAVISKTSSRNLIVLAGDFNAKTGSLHNSYPSNVGKFGKGYANLNGDLLVDLAYRNDLVLTNTLFNHKLAHRTTWESPDPVNRNDKNGEPRRNPYRNQIDYIILNSNFRKYVTDARSYQGTSLYTDHNLVICNLNTSFQPFIDHKKNIKGEASINICNFNNSALRKQYNTVVEQQIKKCDNLQSVSPQQKWTKINEICKSVGLQVLGKTPQKSSVKIYDERIEQLSKKQKKIANDITASRSLKKRKSLKTERNRYLNDIHKIKKELEKEALENRLHEIENSKDDSRRMFQALKYLHTRGKKESVVVKNDNGIVSSDDAKIDIITEHFKKSFFQENVEEFPDIKPEKLNPPFQLSEIKKAIKSLKNNRSPGIDNLNSELIKYGPEILHQHITDLLNEICESGEYPSELKTGLLTPLQKPGKPKGTNTSSKARGRLSKPKGPPQNLRPVILLSCD